MSKGHLAYPSKRVQKPGGNFVVRHFIIPIQIGRTPLWGWVDTGANISVLPKEVAIAELGMEVSGSADGGYDIANLIRVSYQTHVFDLGFHSPIDGTIQRLNEEPYWSETPHFMVTEVEFQIPTLTWPEIADHLEPKPPIMLIPEPIPWVILGMKGVIEKLDMTFKGDQTLRLSPN